MPTERIWAGDVPDVAAASREEPEMRKEREPRKSPYDVTVPGELRRNVAMIAATAEAEALHDTVALAALMEFERPRTLPVLVRGVHPHGADRGFAVLERIGEGKLYRTDYRIEEGLITFGRPVEVEVQFVPKPAPAKAAASKGGRLPEGFDPYRVRGAK